MSRFVKMLHREIELTALKHKQGWQFDTIYFGGGSPALCSPSNIADILNKLRKHFNISENTELTLEVNPGEIKKEDLCLLKNLGVNRLSFGFQSLHQKLLITLSRTHNPDDCLTIYRDARDAGFNNISIDMLYNIPGQSLEDWLKDLKMVSDMKPDHIATYPLFVEEGTPLFDKIKSREITPLPVGTELEMFRGSSQLLAENGFMQYEVSHFAKPEKECRHNQHYWNLEPYLAFGPSAHGYDGKKRWWNVSSLDDYLRILSINELPVSGSEILSPTDRFNEGVMYGLRTNRGIPRKIFQRDEYTGSFHSYIKKWEKHLDISQDTIRVRTGHYHLADEIAIDMLVTS